jgi:hypothetical protein
MIDDIFLITKSKISFYVFFDALRAASTPDRPFFQEKLRPLHRPFFQEKLRPLHRPFFQEKLITNQ